MKIEEEILQMVDIIASQELKEVEDGELPEDGEICDDEDDVKPGSTPSVSTESHTKESRSSSDSHHHHSRRRSPIREKIIDPDPFGPHNDDIPTRDYFENSEADKDYRGSARSSSDHPTQDEDNFSDYDYRQSRRRRHSPGIDDNEYERGGKRPYYGRGGYRGGFRGNTKPRFNTEHQICKFFREGYCRDGDQCSYSHQAEDSLRRPILCNFYANNYCKKGLQCLMLHGEFPCKDFHQGNCHLEQCRFSHVPLTDYTRPLFEKMVEEECQQSGLPPRGGPPSYRQNPSVAARRRVLLPGGPAPGSSPPNLMHSQIPPVAPHMGNGLPPPSVVVPTRNHQGPSYPSTGYFNQNTQQPQNLPPPRNIEPPKPVSQVKEEKPPTPTFNLEAMLNKLAKGESLAEDIDESPASPPPEVTMATASTTLIPVSTIPSVIPDTVPVTWKYLEMERPRAYSGVENAERIPLNDPRKKRALSEQFDAFSSSLISGDDLCDPRLRTHSTSSSSTNYDSFATSHAARISSWMPQTS